jgi:hypothetical protein
MEDKPTYTHTSGEAHPDNNPPLTAVAPVSEEETKKIEDTVNAEIAAQHKANTPPDQAEDKEKEGAEPKVEEASLEEHTVPELKEIAEKKGIPIPWDANKSDIIKAIKKGK